MSRTRSDKAKLTDADNCSNQSLGGYYHEVECNWCVWTNIFLPKGVPRTLLDDLFTCRFCANKKIAELQTNLNNVTQTVPKQNDFSYAEILRNVKNEDQDRKAINLVISGAKPDDHDENLVNNILKDINVVGVQPTSRKRVGKKHLEDKQLLIVSFENNTDRETVLKKAENLKRISKYDKIYINQDPRKSEQESFKKLLAELKKKTC